MLSFIMKYSIICGFIYSVAGLNSKKSDQPSSKLQQFLRSRYPETIPVALDSYLRIFATLKIKSDRSDFWDTLVGADDSLESSFKTIQEELFPELSSVLTDQAEPLEGIVVVDKDRIKSVSEFCKSYLEDRRSLFNGFDFSPVSIVHNLWSNLPPSDIVNLWKAENNLSLVLVNEALVQASDDTKKKK